MHKFPKPTLLFLCAMLGMGYFNAFSSIGLNPIVRSNLILVPIQLGVLVYFLWLRPKSQRTKTPEI